MIIFDLACENGHRFEGWFASSEDFERQQARAMVVCPTCDSHQVKRVPSAVHLAPSAHDMPAAGGQHGLPAVAQPLAVYHRLVKALVATSEDVGAHFAEEVRRMHYEEIPGRAVHGQSSDEEFEELRDEGIEVWRLPALGKDELN